jgi:thymidylate synthase
MLAIQGRTLELVWPQIIKAIMEKGEEVIDQRGSKTKELTNVVWTINDPEASGIPEGNPLGPNALEQYKTQFLDPELHDFVYTYGNRLNKYEIFYPILSKEKEELFKKIKEMKFPKIEKNSNLTSEEKIEKIRDKKLEEFHKVMLNGRYYFLNQVKQTIDYLKENPNTRRAIMITWKFPVDFLVEEVPCLIMVDFLIREGKLLTTAVWRSHDTMAMVPNFIALRELSRHVAKEVGIPVGSITIQSISAHIYFWDFEVAEKIANNKNFTLKRGVQED